MDVKTKEIITVDNDNGFSYTCKMNYQTMNKAMEGDNLYAKCLSGRRME